ncbi:MAG: hypothetical protein WDM90_20080 [Ferruginibacter sp.]
MQQKTIFNSDKSAALKFNLQYADTVKSPAAALFAAASPPIGLDQIQLPLQKLTTRFPKHNGIMTLASFAKQELSKQQMQSQMQQEQQQAALPLVALRQILP